MSSNHHGSPRSRLSELSLISSLDALSLSSQYSRDDRFVSARNSISGSRNSIPPMDDGFEIVTGTFARQDTPAFQRSVADSTSTSLIGDGEDVFSPNAHSLKAEKESEKREKKSKRSGIYANESVHELRDVDQASLSSLSQIPPLVMPRWEMRQNPTFQSDKAVNNLLMMSLHDNELMQVPKKSKSALRRNRRKKFIKGKQQRCEWQDTVSSSERELSNDSIAPEGFPPTLSDPLTSSKSISESEPNENKSRKKTNRSRRGGKRARKRYGHLGSTKDIEEVDKTLESGDDAILNIPPSSMAEWSSFEAKTPARGSHSEKRAIDGDGNKPCTPLATEKGTYTAKSNMKANDAATSINNFLSDPRNYMLIKENKLKLWQSFCIEASHQFGLVSLEGQGLASLPVVTTTPRRPGKDSSPASPDKRPIYPLPTTLNQAKMILQNHAHVNLMDYFQARRIGTPKFVGAYAGLLYPSESSLRRYTMKNGKYAPKVGAKDEWLQPLMRDMSYRLK
nr:hypothetical protein L203_05168 [Cryptococcus depauperatus CBS 7841]